MKGGIGDGRTMNHTRTNVIIRNAIRLQRITEDILDITRIESKSLGLKKELFNLGEMIRNAIAVCDKHRDSATSNELQQILDETERRTWFLFEIMQGVNNTA